MSAAEVSDFLNSPYFNDRRLRKEVVVLFEHIVEDHPACSRDELSKESTHKRLFGDKPYVENRLNHIMTALSRTIESFVAQRFSHVNQEIAQHFAMALFYQEREMPQRFEATISQVEDLLSKVSPESEDTLWLKYRLEYMRHQQSGLYQNRSTDLNLSLVLTSLDAYYIAQRLIISASLLTQRNLVKMDASSSMAIYDYISKQEQYGGDIAQKTLIKAYYKLQPLLTDEADLDYLDGFRHFVKEAKNDLPPVHLKSLYTIIRNYLVVRYNSGESEVLPMLFSNLNDEYEQGFLNETNGMMRASTFQNMVTTGLKLKHYEWTRELINNCRGKITGASEPENVLIFNDANLFFHLGDHDAALSTGFNQLKYDNFVYSLASRRLEVKIWFEKNDYDMAEYRLNALKSYLFSNKNNMPDQVWLNNNDFVDIFRQLMSTRNKGNSKRLTTLKEKFLTDKKNIAEREWFMEVMKLPGRS